MGREYVTPVAIEEAFAANNYVAACDWQITSTSGNNRMQCANPSHRHFMNGTYFTSVWVEATNSTCRIKVDQSGIEKTAILNGNNAQPAYGASVYGVSGAQYLCMDTHERNGVTYFVPSFVPSGNNLDSTNSNPCYGTYVNTGDYSEIKEKVFS